MIQADGARGAAGNCSRRATGSSVCSKRRELWGPRLDLPWLQVLGAPVTHAFCAAVDEKKNPEENPVPIVTQL